jgi:hypothetical protein
VVFNSNETRFNHLTRVFGVRDSASIALRCHKPNAPRTHDRAPLLSKDADMAEESPATPREQLLNPEQIPAEVRLYMAELQPHFALPFVQRHFRQITCLSFVTPDQKAVDFFALEFRVAQEAALIWTDGRGQWGAGGWLPLAHPDADLATPPSALTMDYFEGALVAPSLQAAIDMLTEYE